MRIAILANIPVWTIPGLEKIRHQRHYATWLEPLIPEFSAFPDLEIHWITMCKEANGNIRHNAYGQTFHILSRGSLAAQMLTGYAGELMRIRKVLNAIKPDVVHAWGSEDVYGLAGSMSGVSRRIFTLQGCLTEYLRILGGSSLFRIQALYEKPVIRRYRKATAESIGAADLIRAINPQLDIELVDYGVNPAFSEAVWNPAAVPEVLFVGSISKRKGIPDLVAVASLPEMSHIQFKIAGEGNLRCELEKESPKNVVWLGNCSRSELIRHLEAAWVLYVPTYSDTGPTVVKEARVVGLPIVCTTGAGASSYVSDEDCGFVCEPGDLGAHAAALERLTSSRDQALLYGSRGHHKHLEQLHPKTTAKRFAEVYRKMAKETWQ